MPQATGWAGAGGGGLVSQPTGFQDPRLQMMQSSFMPMNTASVSRASTLSPSLLRRSLPHAVGRAAPEPRPSHSCSPCVFSPLPSFFSQKRLTQILSSCLAALRVWWPSRLPAAQPPRWQPVVFDEPSTSADVISISAFPRRTALLPLNPLLSHSLTRTRPLRHLKSPGSSRKMRRRTTTRSSAPGTSRARVSSPAKSPRRCSGSRVSRGTIWPRYGERAMMDWCRLPLTWSSNKAGGRAPPVGCVWVCSLTDRPRHLCIRFLIRTLADMDNRGKLNIQEFHVAMGLIYRSQCRVLDRFNRQLLCIVDLDPSRAADHRSQRQPHP